MITQYMLGSLVALVLIASAAPAVSQPTSSVSGDDLMAMVSGRSWALSTYGDISNPATTMVWDFLKDGSVCARPGASKVGDKCFDKGRWAIRGNVLCWDLTWFGDSVGLKSTCSTVWKVGPERIELRSEKTPELTGIVAKPL